MSILDSTAKGGWCGFSKMSSTIFYMKTWQCEGATPYFNLTTNLCQDDCGLYYFKNTTALECHNCDFGCADCTDINKCTGCDTARDNRELIVGNSSSTC